MNSVKENKKELFFQKSLLRFFLLFFLGYFFPVAVYAEDNLLQIKPARCIALHEGQVCYQKLTINWQAENADTYCLTQENNKAPLLCWENIVTGKGVYEFESNVTQKFLLIRKRDNKTMAEFSIEVAWVYDARSHRESHWRIF
jgi:hypothetical protein